MGKVSIYNLDPSSELMEQAKQLTLHPITRYEKWCNENPIMVHKFIGRDKYSVHLRKARVPSVAGFKQYCRAERITIKLSSEEKEWLLDYIESEVLALQAAGAVPLNYKVK